MSFRYGVFVSSAVLTFGLASTVFLLRTDSALRDAGTDSAGKSGYELR